MLRQQDNEFRETKSLNGLWDFCVDRAGQGRHEGWWQARLPDAVPMPVPCSFNDLLADRDVKDHVGDVWYQRSVFVPSAWGGDRIAIRFDAATHRASVWIDEAHVGEHEGGYTPFEVDLPAAAAGREVRITVVVNNELTWHSLPPGVVTDTGGGRRTQHQFHDFFNYAGLHRNVWLCRTPTDHIVDITVTTGLAGTTGTVGYAITTTQRPGDAQLSVDVSDVRGTVVASGSGPDGMLRVADVHRWEPGHGYLYMLDVLLSVGGEPRDRYRLPVGVRTVDVVGTEFLVNGVPFHFRGFGKHEDTNIHGRGHDDAAMVHDFSLLRWIGANSFRTSHYPYAEEVLDLADRLGVVVVDETAAVGINLGMGAAFLSGGGARPTFSDTTIDGTTQGTHRRAIEELIARDKNHPSVVLWSLANEPESHTDAAREYFTPLFAAARRADPSRPMGFVNVMFAPPDRCQVTELADVVMVNRYYGWYVDTGDLGAAEQELERELVAWSGHGKPILVTEYGADSVPGLHSFDRVAWSEEYQVDLLDTYHRVFDRIDAVVGEHVWNFADFATGSSFIRVDGNKKGVFTRDRQPKAAAHLLRQRWASAGSDPSSS